MEAIFKINKFLRSIIIISFDILVSFFCTWLAFSVRYEIIFIPDQNLTFAFIIPAISFLIIFRIFNLYSNLNRFTGFNTIQVIIYANSINIILVSSIFIFASFSGVPRSIGLLSTIFFSAYVIVSRVLISQIYLKYVGEIEKKRVLLYGNNKTGLEALNALRNQHDYKILGLITSEDDQLGKKIDNVNIYGVKKLKKIINSKRITNVIFALTSYEITKKRELINYLKDINIEVSQLPSISKILSGKISFSDLKEIELKDIFSRSIDWDTEKIELLLNSKRVMITGAGGSIGSELSRQVLNYSPKQIILIDNTEFNLFTIERELSELMDNIDQIDVIPILADITDAKNIENIFNKTKPNIVFHAAAYKHVDLVERNFSEAMKNNLIGTINLIKSSLNNSISNFHFVSTDKAVRPKSFMGLSKRIAEIYLQSFYNKIENSMNVSIVRFGNVLGSSGSVVPLFTQQLKKGGPLTVTHKDAERYFMTIPEATGLILQSSTIGKECEVYILDMGKPWKILDLAKSMINLSGLREKQNNIGDIEIIFTGLKKGEKIKEELVFGNELSKTKYKEIYVSKENYISFKELDVIINKLYLAINKNEDKKVVDIAKSIVLLADNHSVN